MIVLTSSSIRQIVTRLLPQPSRGEGIFRVLTAAQRHLRLRRGLRAIPLSQEQQDSHCRFECCQKFELILFMPNDRQVSDKSCRQTWHGRREGEGGVLYVVTLHLFMTSHRVQHSKFRKITSVKSRMHEHCTQNKRGIDESPTRHGTETRAISGKWHLNKCLMASTEHICA